MNRMNVIFDYILHKLFQTDTGLKPINCQLQSYIPKENNKVMYYNRLVILSGYSSIINSVNCIKLACYNLPPTQHHSFCGNLPPLFVCQLFVPLNTSNIRFIATFLIGTIFHWRNNKETNQNGENERFGAVKKGCQHPSHKFEVFWQVAQVVHRKWHEYLFHKLNYLACKRGMKLISFRNETLGIM